MILTKMPNVYDPKGEKDTEDITQQYKAPEGSKYERLSLYNAVRNTTRAKRYYDVPEETVNDVEFALTDLETVDMGQPFTVTVTVTNKSDQVRTIEAVLSAQSVYYTGVKAGVLKKSAGDLKLKPKATQTIRMTALPKDYISGLVE